VYGTPSAAYNALAFFLVLIILPSLLSLVDEVLAINSRPVSSQVFTWIGLDFFL
jgi:hypothetical protein